MILSHAFATHVGCTRTENQDSYVDLSHKGVFAIADGMGGHQGGREASTLACRAFEWQCDHDPGQTSEYIRQAHELIVRANQEKAMGKVNQGIFQQMGTTGVVVHIQAGRDEYAVSWCGDSRLYHWSAERKKLDQITIDHSVVQGRLGRGEITFEQSLSEKKNTLEHAIGVGTIEDLHVDTRRRQLKPGDILMLCTDGICNEVDDEHMAEIFGDFISKNKTARTLALELLQEALDGGGNDNATVAVICTKEEEF